MTDPLHTDTIRPPPLREALTVPDAIDPATWTVPAMRRALAARDLGTVYRLLTKAGVSQRRIAELTGQRQSEVSEVLAGRQVLAYDVLARVADGLGVPRGWMGLAYDRAYAGDQAPPPAGGEEVTEDMKRRAFLAAASLALWGRPVLGEVLELPARPDSPTPLPTQLGAADVNAIRALTERMRSLARFYGGQAETVAAVANRSMRLLSVPAAEPVQRSLASAVAELHGVAAWCAFDSGREDAARYHYGRTVELGSDADDAYRQASALALSGVAVEEGGDPSVALKLLQLALIKLGDVPADDERRAALEAWVRADSATALHHLGQPAQARSELAAAREGWQPADTHKAGDVDHVAARLALETGQLDTAAELAAASVRRWEGHPNRRAAVLPGITLATIHVRAGEPDGPALARRAIDGVAELRSQRARDRLAPLVNALAARRDTTSRDLARLAAAVRSGGAIRRA